MKRGQITIFLLLGIVLVVAVVFLLFSRKALAPQNPEPGVIPDVILARTCLADATQSALQALENDGVILVNESGPLEKADSDPNYVYVDFKIMEPPQKTLPIGTYGFIGLCNTTSPENGLQAVDKRKFTCDNTLYQYANTDLQNRFIPSIQDQLRTSINKQMGECANVSGDAKVIIQEDGFIVTWEDLDIEYGERSNLHQAFRAIQAVVTKEVSQTDYSLNKTVDGAYIYRELAENDCVGCAGIRVEPVPPEDFAPEHELEDAGDDMYQVNVSGTVIRFWIRDRGVFHKDILLSGESEISLEQEFSYVCEPEEAVVSTNQPDSEFPEQLRKDTISRLTTCKSNNELTWYSFDDDTLTARADDNTEYNGVNDPFFTLLDSHEDERCGYTYQDTNTNTHELVIPCVSTIGGMDRFIKYGDSASTESQKKPYPLTKPFNKHPITKAITYDPSTNDLFFMRGCYGATIPWINISDGGLYSNKLSANVPAASQLNIIEENPDYDPDCDNNNNPDLTQCWSGVCEDADDEQQCISENREQPNIIEEVTCGVLP